MILRPSTDQIREAVKMYGSHRAAARYLTNQGFKTSARSIGRVYEPEEYEVEPGPRVDIDELIRRRDKAFQAKKAQHNYEKMINVKVRVEGPIGLGLFGDWHVDDDGTDVALLDRHLDIFSNGQSGLFAGLLGDLYNNWVGGLARLWSEQSTNSEEARALMEEFLTRANYLFAVQGNHDAWAGHNNIIDYMIRNQTQINAKSRAKLRLNFPNGRACGIYAAHDFPGRSPVDETYGIKKRALADGTCDIYCAGDTHTSGYGVGVHGGTQKPFHAIRIASYKSIDRYANDLNLQDKSAFVCPVALIDPNASDPMNFIRWEFEPEEGAERLHWMRQRFEEGRSLH
jgi:hypothetical protein